MKFDSYCLDTHSLVWYFLKQKTLSLKAEEIIRDVFTGQAVGIISIMTVLEAYYVSLKERKFIFKNFMEVLENSEIKVVPFDKEILSKCVLLPTNINIHDRIIAATAIVINSQLVTKDRVLRSFFPLETIW